MIENELEKLPCLKTLYARMIRCKLRLETLKKYSTRDETFDLVMKSTEKQFTESEKSIKDIVANIHELVTQDETRLISKLEEKVTKITKEKQWQYDSNC